MIQGNIASAINTIQANKVTDEGTQGMQGLMIRWSEASARIEFIARGIRWAILYENLSYDLDPWRCWIDLSCNACSPTPFVPCFCQHSRASQLLHIPNFDRMQFVSSLLTLVLSKFWSLTTCASPRALTIFVILCDICRACIFDICTYVVGLKNILIYGISDVYAYVILIKY